MTPSIQYLDEITARIARIRADEKRRIDIGESMAKHLLAGGEFFCPPICKWWTSEFSGRAGGLMGLHWGTYAGSYVSNNRNDVAYVALPREWNEKSQSEWKKLADSPARIFAIGEPTAAPKSDRIE